MTVVDAKICRQMEDALRAVMETPIPHAVGCSHDDKTCTCHRAKAFAALNNFKSNDQAQTSSKTRQFWSALSGAPQTQEKDDGKTTGTHRRDS